MYDTIVNPVSSRQVKTTSKLGKKLLHNYEDKFDYVINPETNKIVQSGGKVGQQVLKKYKQKGVSTNVSGGGGKKKIKRSGGGKDEDSEYALREAYAQRQQQEQRQAPREYTCKSIDNSTEEQNTGFKVKCKSNKCTPDDFNEFKDFIQINKSNEFIEVNVGPPYNKQLLKIPNFEVVQLQDSFGDIYEFIDNKSPLDVSAADFDSLGSKESSFSKLNKLPIFRHDF